jgi:adenosine kinase
MNVAVVGSIALDYIMNFNGRFTDRIMEDKIHSLSLSFLAESLKKQFGGTGGNIAYSLKLLGVTPFLLGCVGDDFASYKAFLLKNKIPLDYIKEYKKESCSSYFVVTDLSNNQIGSFYIGAMKHAAKLSVRDIKKPFEITIIAPTDPKAMISAVSDCTKNNLPYVYDPAFQIATFTKEQLQEGVHRAAIVIGNDYEIALIEEKLEMTHEALIAKVPILITTLGEKGSIIENKKESIHIKPAKVKKVVDPTGAGDAFRSGFLAGYVRKFPLDVCGMMGSVASAYTVELYGTQTHAYTKQEFLRRFESNYSAPIKL